MNTDQLTKDNAMDYLKECISTGRSIDFTGLSLEQQSWLREARARYIRIEHLRLGTCADCLTADSLSDRIASYVEMRGVDGFAQRVGSLNRRYGRKAKQLKTSVMQILTEHETSGRLVTHQHKHGALVMIPALFSYMQQCEPDEVASFIKNAE